MEEVVKTHEVVYINKNEEDYKDQPLEADTKDSSFLYLVAVTSKEYSL